MYKEYKNMSPSLITEFINDYLREKHRNNSGADSCTLREVRPQGQSECLAKIKILDSKIINSK
jgi:hypothetical protein